MPGAALLLFSCSSADPTTGEDSNNSTQTEAPTDTEAPVKDTLEISGHIEFPSQDGTLITADSYESLPGKDFILLCHQANFSRGEYVETARQLSDMGYNCLAIDQRSGNTCNKVENMTAKRAREKGLNTDYTDAEQDILAALDYIYNKSGKKVIVVGSSYSASLLLKIAKNNEKISAVAVFSPGEYLKGTDLKKEIAGLNIPVFATSSKKEAKEVADLLTGVVTKDIFVPTVEGEHGSKALWSSVNGHEEYWRAFKTFLNKQSKATI